MLPTIIWPVCTQNKIRWMNPSIGSSRPSIGVLETGIFLERTRTWKTSSTLRILENSSVAINLIINPLRHCFSLVPTFLRSMLSVLPWVTPPFRISVVFRVSVSHLFHVSASPFHRVVRPTAYRLLLSALRFIPCTYCFRSVPCLRDSSVLPCLRDYLTAQKSAGQSVIAHPFMPYRLL